ncbi:MAG: hypothetical protein EXS10_08745 [Phycisphaerales bacterium]|nr:hypothetical protein [Phycisphaerales bacterium]
MAKTTTRKKSSSTPKLTAVPNWLRGINDVIDAIEPSKDGTTWCVKLAGGGELECDAPVAVAAGLATSGRVTESTIKLLAKLSLEHLARTESMRLLVSKNPPATAAALLEALKSSLMEPVASRTVVAQLVKDGWIGKVAKPAAKKTAKKTTKKVSAKVATKVAKKTTKKVAKAVSKKATKKVTKRAR